MKQTAKKWMVWALCAALMVQALAPGMARAAGAAGKDETVYVNMDAAGGVEAIYVINSFEVAAGETIVDRGRYKSVKNLTTTDELRVEDGTVRVTSPGGTFYYEGEMEPQALPWSVAVRYELDGQAVEPQQLAGRSGRVAIHVSLTHTPGADETFTEHYAVQASMALDGDLFRNIDAPDATVVNAGGSTQLSYIVLPGNEKSFTVSADATDFEFGGLSVNMLPLSIGIETPDTEEIKDMFRELQDGAVEMDDGVGELYDGTKDLHSGIRDLADGVGELDDGVRELLDGVNDLVDGVREMYDGTDELQDGTQELYDGMSDMQDGAHKLKDGVGQMITAAGSLDGGMDKLAGQSGKLAQGSTTIRETLVQLTALVNGITGGVQSASAQTMAVDYTAQVQQLDALIASYEALLGASPAAVVPPAPAVPIATPTGYSYAVASPTTPQPPAQQQAEGIPTELIQQTILTLKAMRDQYALLAQQEAATARQMNPMAMLALMVNGLNAQYGEFDDGLQLYAQGVVAAGEGMKGLIAGLGELYWGAYNIDGGIGVMADGVGDLRDGVVELHDGVGELADGTTEMADGVGELADGTGEMRDGMGDLISGTGDLRDGVGELKDGTGELRTETADIDGRIDEEIDKMMEEYSGGDVVPVSFADAGNTDVNAVQFIMKTAAINVEESAEAFDDELPELTFWQRLKNLFIKKD